MNEYRQVNFVQAQQLASRLGCLFAVEVSNKTGEGITEAMDKFVSVISRHNYIEDESISLLDNKDQRRCATCCFCC